MLCTKTLSLKIKEMASINFPVFGSYFADAPIDSRKKVPFEHGFCVGPHCSPVFWNRSPGEAELYGGPSPNCGPCKLIILYHATLDFNLQKKKNGMDLASYCSGLIDTGYSRIPERDAIIEELLPYHGSIEDHIRLLNISREIMQKLIEDMRIQNAATPTLIHADFHKRNIYVLPDDPTIITGIVDWQSTSIEPAFVYANETPDFAAPPEEDMLNEEDEPKTSEAKRRVKDASICYQTYDVCMKGFVPNLHAARLLDPTLFRLFHYSHTSWRDSAAAVRQELIEFSTRWKELGMQGSCPYAPTEKEISEHARQFEDFETVQKLKLWLKQSLNTNSDGWVPNEVWDAAKDAHKAAYEEWIQTARASEARGDDLTVAKADKLWPFDLR